MGLMNKKIKLNYLQPNLILGLRLTTNQVLSRRGLTEQYFDPVPLCSLVKKMLLS